MPPGIGAISFRLELRRRGYCDRAGPPLCRPVPVLEVAGLARAIDVAARLKQLVSVACFDDRQHLDEFVPELVDV